MKVFLIIILCLLSISLANAETEVWHCEDLTNGQMTPLVTDRPVRGGSQVCKKVVLELAAYNRVPARTFSRAIQEEAVKNTLEASTAEIADYQEEEE